MTYDIPGRTGTPIQPETFARIAEHPRIVANKDAKADVAGAAVVIASTGLAWYSGDDALTLPLLSVGAVGVVSVVGHLLSDRIGEMMAAHRSGEVGPRHRAQRLDDPGLRGHVPHPGRRSWPRRPCASSACPPGRSGCPW